MNAARNQELQRAGDGAVAHASALLHKYTKYSMTEDEVRDVLEQQPELHDAVSAHLANLQSKDRSQNDELRMKLRQRAQKGLATVGLQLDKSVGGKTQCRCFIEKASFSGAKLKLVDLDSEGYQSDCEAGACFDACGGDDKYKFDPDEAEALGAKIGNTPRKVAQCEENECKCLDATQSMERIKNANKVLTWLNNKVFGNDVKLDVVHEPKNGGEYDDPTQCLQKCRYDCEDLETDDIEIDREAMCIDEWH